VKKNTRTPIIMKLTQLNFKFILGIPFTIIPLSYFIYDFYKWSNYKYRSLDRKFRPPPASSGGSNNKSF